MMEALSTPSNRKLTFIFLATCGVLAIAAAAIGIDDNPPGIVLAFLSACSFVLAFVHPWRTSKQFRNLIYASGLGFIVFGILHNLLELTIWKSGSTGLVAGLLGGASAIFFLIATLLCPPGLVVGAVGAVFMYRRERHSLPGAPV